MLELHETSSFKLVDNALNIRKKLSTDLSLYTIERRHIDRFIPDMRGFKYVLTKGVMDSYTKGEIIPVLMAEGKDIRTPPILFPTSIRSWTNRDKTSVYIDFSHSARYIREKTDKSVIHSLKMTVNDMFASLELAYLNLYIKKHETSLLFSKEFLKNSTMAYAKLFVKVLDRYYPITTNPDKYNAAVFLISYYFLKNLVKLSDDRVLKLLLSFPGMSEDVIITNCKAYRAKDLDWADFDTFLKTLEKELSLFIKEGSLNERSVSNMYVKQYGESAFFAIQNVSAFIQTICIASLGVGFYNDKMVTKIIEKEIKGLESAMIKIFS